MKQYLNLLNKIKSDGTVKPSSRSNMPGTQSLFGHQFRHNLADGFPLLTTKKMFWKGVVIELLWFLRGDTNIKYLVDNGVNIWNEDAYQYYLKICKKNSEFQILNFESFISEIKSGEIKGFVSLPNYKLGDCGHQYGKVWRDFGDSHDALNFNPRVDQIKNLIEGLRKNPESRRHIVTAWDPTHDQDLALTWCHALFQMNCRPLTVENPHDDLDEMQIPKYYLDCQLYQRSADVFLGVPFNIASYALLTEILAKMCNMIPGEIIMSYGDVHIYDNHKDAVEEQLSRTPTALPKLKLHFGTDESPAGIDWTGDIDSLLKQIEMSSFAIGLESYNPQPSIKAELSTGLKK